MKKLPTFSQIKNLLKDLNIPSRAIVYVLVALSLCFLIKYTFINTCIGSNCPNKDGEISSSLLTIGGLLAAIIALVPAFWVEGKLKDAKEEVRRQVTEEIRKEVANIAKTQMLLFRAHRDSQPGTIFVDEAYIQEAILLTPEIKKQEYPFLGKRFAKVALELNAQASISPQLGMPPSNDTMYPSSNLYPSNTIYPMDIKTAVERATFYLEESLSYPETVDRELYVALACMYGYYPHRYEEMIRYIEKAIHQDPFVKEDFANYYALALLSQACNGNLKKLERIGNIIQVELPLSKGDFLKIIQKIAPTNSGHYLQGYAIKKTDGHLHYIKLSAAQRNGKNEVVTAFYYRESIHKLDNFLADQETISLEELYDRIDQKFYLIAFKDE